MAKLFGTPQKQLMLAFKDAAIEDIIFDETDLTVAPVGEWVYVMSGNDIITGVAADAVLFWAFGYDDEPIEDK